MHFNLDSKKKKTHRTKADWAKLFKIQLKKINVTLKVGLFFC